MADRNIPSNERSTDPVFLADCLRRLCAPPGWTLDELCQWAAERIAAETSGERTFWSPDARYLVTAHATRDGIITLQDDNGKEWRATGPQEDMANRCHCGAYEWTATTGRITDASGRVHLKDRCSPVKSEGNAS